MRSNYRQVSWGSDVPRQIIEYRVLVISPADMAAAREAVRSAISDWNAHIGVGKGVRMEAVGWESHAYPDSGAEPQAIINQQIGDECDIGVALFGSRLGSPTSAAPSGSAEEIDRLIARGAPVMIYRSSEAIKPDSIDPGQLETLRAYLDKMKKSNALLGDFPNTTELRRLLAMHLTSAIDAILGATPSPLAGPGTAKLPDVRVTVSAGLPVPESPNPMLRAVLSTAVENHSPSPFYFSNYYFELENGHSAQPFSDALTLQPVGAKVIQPGDSVLYTVSAPQLMQDLKENKTTLVRAVVVDKIGRKFYSTNEAVSIALKNVETWLK
jgi:hypothetical protein